MLKNLRLFSSLFFLSVLIQNFYSLCCFENEVETLNIASKTFQDLQQAFLHDPIIGMKSSSRLAQPLAWSFSLWDLAPHKGGLAKMATIDTEQTAKDVSQKILCENCKKSHMVQKKIPPLSLVENFENICPCGWCKRAFFLYILKNISQYHGMCTHNIIYQIAPQVTIATYNIFDDYGYTSNVKLLSALKKISSEPFDIVHLGCKISSRIVSPKDQNALEEQLCNLNYIVAAAGNDRVNQKESYPARSSHVAFDVGAFSPHKYDSYSICSFSQFELGVGPKVVAPGLDIACPITINDHFLGYAMLSGTSVAAAIVSGLLALVISEFKSDFSYKEMLTVLYQSTQKLSDQRDWQEKVLLGALDTRSALFCLHVLKEIKKILPAKYFHRHYVDLTKQIIFINNIYYFLDNNHIQDFLHDYTQKNNLQEKVLYSAQLAIAAYHPSIQKGYFKKLFDKKLLYLLRSIKKNTFKTQGSNLEYDRIKFSLNRKK